VSPPFTRPLPVIVSAATFDPATLSLAGWWRANSTTGYQNSTGTFDGVASAGSSGSRDLTQATGGNRPADGTAINGHTPPDFDATDDYVEGTTVGTFISTTAYRYWALVYIDAISTNSANPYDNDAIWYESGQNFGLHVRDNAGTKTAYAYHWDGAAKAASATISTGAWTLIQARYDGTDIRLKVDNGTVQTAAASTATGTTTTNLRLGAPATLVLDGRIADVGFLTTAGSDADFDDIRTYVNARYGLSL